MDYLHERLERLEQRTFTVERQLRWWRGLACSLIVLAGLTWALPMGSAQEEDAKEKGQKGLAHRVAALEKLLKHFSREGKEIFITGANLHIINGLGTTDTTNGLGNLIVGYNESRQQLCPPPLILCADMRTGSHNVVVGRQHNFSRFGGMVVGIGNEISGDFAAVSGGLANLASGLAASVNGGIGNTASGGQASVSGGFGNTASGPLASVSGGSGNTATSDEASISGGIGNTASSGFASVSGGSGNTAAGPFSSVSGGLNRTAEGEFDWVAGSLLEDE